MENELKEISLTDILTGGDGTMTPEQRKSEQPEGTPAAQPEKRPKGRPKKVDNIPAEVLAFGIKPEGEGDPTNITEVLKYAKEKHGFTIDQPKDLIPIFDKYKQAENEISVLNDKAKKAEGYENLLNSLPDEIFLPLNDFINGKDYLGTIQNVLKAKTDYTRDVNSFSKDDLIIRYNQGLTKEDLIDLPETAKSALYNTAITAFNLEKNQVVSRVESKKQEIINIPIEREQSIEDSIAELKRIHPEFTAQMIGSIRDKMKANYTLTDGHKYKKDAAYRIAMAEYAPNVIKFAQQTIMAEAQKKINQNASQEREELYLRMNGEPPVTKHIDSQNQLSKVVREKNKFLHQTNERSLKNMYKEKE